MNAIDFNATLDYATTAGEIIPGDWVNPTGGMDADYWHRVTRITVLENDNPNQEDIIEVHFSSSAIAQSKRYLMHRPVSIRVSK